MVTPFFITERTLYKRFNGTLNFKCLKYTVHAQVIVLSHTVPFASASSTFALLGLFLNNNTVGCLIYIHPFWLDTCKMFLTVIRHNHALFAQFLLVLTSEITYHSLLSVKPFLGLMSNNPVKYS